MGWVVNATSRLLDPWERYAVPILQEAGWAPGPVWTGAKNLAYCGIRSPDRLACRESHYRPSNRGPEWKRRKKKLNVSLHNRVFQHMPQMTSDTTKIVGLTDTFRKNFWHRTCPDEKWGHPSQNFLSVVIFSVPSPHPHPLRFTASVA